jgi:hypothetical protein
MGTEFAILPLPFRIPGGGTIVYQNEGEIRRACVPSRPWSVFTVGLHKSATVRTVFPLKKSQISRNVAGTQ